MSSPDGDAIETTVGSQHPPSPRRRSCPRTGAVLPHSRRRGNPRPYALAAAQATSLARDLSAERGAPLGTRVQAAEFCVRDGDIRAQDGDIRVRGGEMRIQDGEKRIRCPGHRHRALTTRATSNQSADRSSRGYRICTVACTRTAFRTARSAFAATSRGAGSGALEPVMTARRGRGARPADPAAPQPGFLPTVTELGGASGRGSPRFDVSVRGPRALTADLAVLSADLAVLGADLAVLGADLDGLSADLAVLGGGLARRWPGTSAGQAASKSVSSLATCSVSTRKPS
ncbi:hypothetical protein SAMN05421630_105361 [Prauserella marina]|uniref:Uncharacterized protein n=1 Tax=Prauserella marina TaxID=530584 RepID=A0A1G6RNA3_9PSEU|nr:hypothetical protein DES30_105360 [Prauserella marina]SDD05426.1 hypothetical protein SAMN05421630_105361 [Prauserella marina]